MHIVRGWANAHTPPSYAITDSTGKKIASGGDNADVEIDLKVPVAKPGFYELNFIDKSGLWSIQTAADQVIALPIGLSSGFNTYRNATPDLYFYVPKGTSEINYYFRRTAYGITGPHIVVDPNGKTVQEVNVDGAYVTVPVAPGMDGKAWHFSTTPDNPTAFGLGQFHFFNVPDILSTSPARMVLPEDIVKKDGLKIVK